MISNEQYKIGLDCGTSNEELFLLFLLARSAARHDLAIGFGPIMDDDSTLILDACADYFSNLYDPNTSLGEIKTTLRRLEAKGLINILQNAQSKMIVLSSDGKEIILNVFADVF